MKNFKIFIKNIALAFIGIVLFVMMLAITEKICQRSVEGLKIIGSTAWAIYIVAKMYCEFKD